MHLHIADAAVMLGRLISGHAGRYNTIAMLPNTLPGLMPNAHCSIGIITGNDVIGCILVDLYLVAVHHYA
jgi:hypothetical protein